MPKFSTKYDLKTVDDFFVLTDETITAIINHKGDAELLIKELIYELQIARSMK